MRRYSLHSTPRVNMMSVWDWSKQFSEEDQSLFFNPMYLARMELDVESVEIPNYNPYSVSDFFMLNSSEFSEVVMSSSSADTISVRNFMMGARNTMNFHRKSKEKEYLPELPAGVLRAVTSCPSMKFWSQCYLRWLTPLQINLGGNPSQYLQQCHLVAEIQNLKHEIKQLDSASKNKTVSSSQETNDNHSNGPLRKMLPKTINSSFPFTTPGSVTGATVASALDFGGLHGLGKSQRYSLDDLDEDLVPSPAEEHENKQFV